MKHLSENELIDILFEEELSAENRRHLEVCATCKTQLKELDEGLVLARQTNPGDFSFEDAPLIRPVKYWKKIGLAVAAIFLMMSFLGFKAELRDGNFSVQLSLFTNPENSSITQTELADLELRIIQQMNMQAELTSSQINQQFSDLEKTQYRDLLDLSYQVKASLDTSEIQTDRRFALFNQDLEALKTQNTQRNHP